MSPVSPDKQAFRKEPPLKAELPELQPKQMEIGAQGKVQICRFIYVVCICRHNI